MKHIKASKKRGLFAPLIKSAAVQAAMMTLQPGQSSSAKMENEHPAAEQWVFVISGSGRAKVGRNSVRITAGSLILIEKRETHQITNTGHHLLLTINFYSPPAYTAAGDVTRLAASK